MVSKGVFMRIRVNGEDKNLGQDQLTVVELLKLQNVEMPEMVSVQVNGSFIAREAFPVTQLKESDEVDFLYFMGGGGRP